jgi:NADH-quinone oxidoreductase subunit H
MNISQWLLTLTGLALVILGLFLIAALMVYSERRLLALMQDRLGPNRAGPFGLLQPAADFLKLLTKEYFTPPFADRGIYHTAPIIVPFTALLSFAVVPISDGWWLADLNIALLFVLALSSLRVYGIMLGGWASNSKYPLLGGLRAAADLGQDTVDGTLPRTQGSAARSRRERDWRRRAGEAETHVDWQSSHR